MFWSGDVPRVMVPDARGRKVEVTLVAGSLGDARPPAPPPSSWAAREENDVAIWTLALAPGARFTLPASARGVSRSLFHFQGAGLAIRGQSVPPMHRVDLSGDAPAELENGPSEAELLLLQGRPIAEPVVQHGPFVMNAHSEIEEAFRDFRRTQFGGWPWPSEDPVHPREEGRFARHADGRVERPEG